MRWLLCIMPGFTSENTKSPIFMFCMDLKTNITSIYNIPLLVFIIDNVFVCPKNWVFILVIQDKWSLQSVNLFIEVHIILVTFRQDLFFYLVGRQAFVEAYKYQNARHYIPEENNLSDGWIYISFSDRAGILV